MFIEIYPNEDVIRQAVGNAIGAVLGSIHGLPHGKTCSEAEADAVATIMKEGWS